MAITAQDQDEITRLRRQRNVFAVLAACSLALIGASVPRKVANYRELKAANDRLVELQASIVGTQRQIRTAQEEIAGYQQMLRAWQAK